MNEPIFSNPLLNREALQRAVGQCRAELAVLQGRLGTPAERVDDVDHASEIVHKINNLTAALSLLPPGMK